MKLRCLKTCLCSVFQKIIYKHGMNVFKNNNYIFKDTEIVNCGVSFQSFKQGNLIPSNSGLGSYQSPISLLASLKTKTKPNKKTLTAWPSRNTFKYLQYTFDVISFTFIMSFHSMRQFNRWKRLKLKEFKLFAQSHTANHKGQNPKPRRQW